MHLAAQLVKNPPAMQETQFNFWVGKIPWRRDRISTPVFGPGESHGQRSPAGYSPWGCKELDTTEQLSVYTHTDTQCICSAVQLYVVEIYQMVILNFSCAPETWLAFLPSHSWVTNQILGYGGVVVMSGFQLPGHLRRVEDWPGRHALRWEASSGARRSFGAEASGNKILTLGRQKFLGLGQNQCGFWYMANTGSSEVPTAPAGQARAVVASHLSTMFTSQSLPPLCPLHPDNGLSTAFSTSTCLSCNLPLRSESECHLNVTPESSSPNPKVILAPSGLKLSKDFHCFIG